MQILCTICARGGSKGVKNKNIRSLDGKPLIAYTIEIAKKWGKFTDIVLSTDSTAIKEVAEGYGVLVPFQRPAELATDTSGKVGVIKHAHKFMEESTKKNYDIIIDLDVTAPLRTIEDLEGAFATFRDNDYDIVYSVCEARKNPYFNMVEIDDKGRAFLSKKYEAQVNSRQAAPKVYELNASIYVYKREYLIQAETVFAEKAGIYIMPHERSIDIDTEIDFVFVEFLLKNNYITRERDDKLE